MHAEFEHLTSVLRVWDDDKKHGDPYWGVAVRWINQQDVEIMLQQQPLTPAIYRTVMQAMAKAGAQRLLIRTYPTGADGPEVSRWRDVPSPTRTEE